MGPFKNLSVLQIHRLKVSTSTAFRITPKSSNASSSSSETKFLAHGNQLINQIRVGVRFDTSYYSINPSSLVT
ncbi:hypothetical protein RJT34_33575 [Clitoria ternatea]|uniref:Uncharacterized protein n=1 Tax=Clitoria ternatea TaxID=43366 RepID=A0AAN9EY18_CLITE